MTFSAPEIESETVRHRQVLPSSFRGGLRSVGRVAHFNGRSIRRSTSLQSFVGKIAVPLLDPFRDPFRDPKNGPARNHKQKLYIYFCRTISGAVKTGPLLGPPFGQTFAVTSFILIAWHQKSSMKQISKLPKRH